MRGGGVYAAVLSPPLSSLTPQHDHAASRSHRMTSSSSSCTTGNGETRASTQSPSAPRPKAVNRNDTNAAHMLRP